MSTDKPFSSAVTKGIRTPSRRFHQGWPHLLWRLHPSLDLLQKLRHEWQPTQQSRPDPEHNSKRGTTEGPSLRLRRESPCVMLSCGHSPENPPSQRLTLPFTLSHLPWAHPWGRVAGPQGSSSGTAPRVSSPEPKSLWPWAPQEALLLFPAS